VSFIKGLDDHAAFFPVNQDNHSSDNINAHNNDYSSTGAAIHHPDFQTVFQTFLNHMTGNRADSPDYNEPAGVLNSLPSMPGANNNAGMLLSIPDQIGHPGGLSQSPDQSGALRLLQSLLDVAKDENKSSTGPVPEIPYSRVISRYEQAMNDFRHAFDLPSAGNPEGLNPHTMNRIPGGEAGGIPVLSGTSTPGVNPTRQEVVDYITGQCRIIGIPVRLGLATAATESNMLQFNEDGMPLSGSNSDSTDWGIMQINDKAWGDTFNFDLIKSDWKYNVRAGLRILKNSYDAAVRNNEDGKGANNTEENLARAAYSGYNAGTGNLWRYRTSIENAPKIGPYNVLSDDGYDIRDIRFWTNYQKSS
jgi:hypothetical protein